MNFVIWPSQKIAIHSIRPFFKLKSQKFCSFIFPGNKFRAPYSISGPVTFHVKQMLLIELMLIQVDLRLYSKCKLCDRSIIVEAYMHDSREIFLKPPHYFLKYQKQSN